MPRRYTERDFLKCCNLQRTFLLKYRKSVFSLQKEKKTAEMKVRRIIWALPFIMVSCSNYDLNDINYMSVFKEDAMAKVQ